MNNSREFIVGAALEDLSLEEMIVSQGNGDVKPETTPVCAAIAQSMVASSMACAGGAAAGAAVSAAVTFTLKTCGK